MEIVYCTCICLTEASQCYFRSTYLYCARSVENTTFGIVLHRSGFRFPFVLRSVNLDLLYQVIYKFS